MPDQERTGVTTMRGNPLTLIGPALQPGDKAPDFQCVTQDMSPVSLSSSAGKTRLLISVPSLDTPTCDRETRHWEEGKSLVFDDTYMHEAWNDTSSDRVVLFMDFVRPLRFPGSLVNWFLLNAIALSPFVLGAAGNYLAWEKRFEAAVNADKKPT